VSVRGVVGIIGVRNSVFNNGVSRSGDLLDIALEFKDFG